MKGFAINENKGFKITFENGVTVSVQFGYGNYCDNRIPSISGKHITSQECINAEVAIWDKSEWITQKYDPSLTDVVMGYVKPGEVAKIIAWAQAYNGA